jgi:hypothetical protein
LPAPFHLSTAALLPLLEGVLILGLAAFLLTLNGRRRTTNPAAARAFAAMLMAAGMELVSSAFAHGSAHTGHGTTALHWARLVDAFNLLFDPLAILFLALYPRPRLGFSGRRWTAIVVLVIVLLQVTYWLDPSLSATYAYESGQIKIISTGPLAAARLVPTVALLALVFAWDATRASSARRFASLALVSLGFALVQAHASIQRLAGYTASVFGWVDGLAWPTNIWGWLRLAEAASRFPLALAAWLLLLHHVRGQRNEPTRRRAVAIYASALALSSVTAIASLGLLASGRVETFLDANAWILFAWRICMPLFVIFVLVRDQLFDLDVRLRWTIKRSTVAAAYLFVFLTATQVAQNFLDHTMGWAVGGLATALLLVMLAPIQRLAERVASMALPDAKPLSRRTDAERRQLYRDLVESAWLDGSLSLAERRVLDTARHRLRLDATEAAAVEADVLSRLGRRSGRRR